MKNYIVSFGDSDKYSVKFDGSKTDFEKSDKLRVIKEKIFGFLKEKFPLGGFENVVKLHVEESDGKSDYPELDASALESLIKSVKRQVEVLAEGKELNLNAPFDKL